MNLTGYTPNGQSFMGISRLIWSIAESRATIRAVMRARRHRFRNKQMLGDFYVPQRGILPLSPQFCEGQWNGLSSRNPFSLNPMLRQRDPGLGCALVVLHHCAFLDLGAAERGARGM